MSVAWTSGGSLSSVIIDSLAFPTALYAADGKLEYANTQFNTMWAALVPDADAKQHHWLDTLMAFLHLPAQMERTDGFADYSSPAGMIAEFALKPLATGGWTLSARDVTSQRRSENEAERTQKVALIALADLAEHRDTDTGEHFLRVARLTYEVSRCLKARGAYDDIIDMEFLRHIGVASILHDVGKVSIPDAILLKPGRLTPEERAIMQCHAASGGALLRKAETMLAGSIHFRLAAEIAECHHERWNGSGYPHGLSGGAIPLAARIVAAADVYDALTSERPYKAAWDQERVLFYLREQSGTEFDPLVVEALLQVLDARLSANTILWTQNMSVGIDAIDHDHRVLLALVNQISSPENRGDQTAVEFVLDELLGYTALHFSREEALLEQAGYPDLENHRRIHRAMIEEVREMQCRQMVAFTPRLGDDLHRFLGNWLTSHILGEDQCYVPYMA